jgi:hypothetical protein
VRKKEKIEDEGGLECQGAMEAVTGCGVEREREREREGAVRAGIAAAARSNPGKGVRYPALLGDTPAFTVSTLPN